MTTEKIEELKQQIADAESKVSSLSVAADASKERMMSAYRDDVRSFIIDQAKMTVKRQPTVTAVLGDGVTQLRAKVETFADSAGEAAYEAMSEPYKKHERLTALKDQARAHFGRLLSSHGYSSDAVSVEKWQWYDVNGIQRYASFPETSSGQEDHRKHVNRLEEAQRELGGLRVRLGDLQGEAAWGD